MFCSYLNTQPASYPFGQFADIVCVPVWGSLGVVGLGLPLSQGPPTVLGGGGGGKRRRGPRSGPRLRPSLEDRRERDVLVERTDSTF